MTHICVSKLTIIDSNNGLSPGRRQAIIWTNAGLLLIVPLGTNFSEILIEILTLPFKKMRLNVSSAKRRPFCLGLNVLILWLLMDGIGSTVLVLLEYSSSASGGLIHLPPWTKCRPFGDDVFKCIFLNENVWILIKISLKFDAMGLVDNKWALVQEMAWRRSCDESLSEPMLTQFTDAYMRHYGRVGVGVGDGS